MEVHVLASGSSGNAVFIREGRDAVLVDAGISARQIQASLEQLGGRVQDLKALFLTHEHVDHVKALPTLLKKYPLPVYTRPGTWENLPFKTPVPAECFCPLEPFVRVGDLLIAPFSIPHDAADPVGYTIVGEQEKCCVATDLGFVTQEVREALSFSDIMVLESNHDLNMLRQGPYPWHLKKRILSTRGHLSNLDTAWTLARLPRKAKTQVFLAHISKENNHPELARNTVASVLTGQGVAVGEDVLLHLTYPDQLTGTV